MSPSDLGFAAPDKRRLAKALNKAVDAHVYRRLQAVLLIANGRRMTDVVTITRLSQRTVYHLVERYRQSHCIESLYDLPRGGRPRDAPRLTEAQILRELQRSPLPLGYRTNVWTVKTLAQQLTKRYHHCIAPWTLRRRMKQMDLVCKRPRYYYEEKAPRRAQKKGPSSGP